MSENKTKRFVFEIYVENIPARFIIPALKQEEELAAAFLKENNLQFGEIKTFGTYRRLILSIDLIPSRTAEKTEFHYGPPARLLKDENGNYTKQAIGFASSFNTTPEKLKIAILEKKGEVLCFEKRIQPISAVKVLSNLCVHIIKNLQFPKSMVWEESRLRFARPIRNLLAIYGNSTVPFKIAGLKSGKFTYGLASLGSPKIQIKDADSYTKAMQKAQVIVNDIERKEKILRDLKNAASTMRLSFDRDEGLVEENVYLTEYPSCVPVKYPNEFLQLPAELISLVMKNQLKFFPCYKGKETAPFFIGIRDGISRGTKNVEEGFLNVFAARCRDAMFFYDKDIKTPAEELRRKISFIAFQEKLGTMADKKDRVVRNLKNISEQVNFVSEEMEKAASFCYLDLASNVVREFPELQGIMSGYYGKYWGLDEKASLILKEFYVPVSPTDSLPSSKEASLLSLAGRIDTLAGDFALGLIPTGSQDPHGLRRLAYGIVRIVCENDIRLNLKDSFVFALSILGKDAQVENYEKVWDQIAEFLWMRFENIFSEKFKSGEFSAIKEIFVKEGDFVKAVKRAEALKKLRGSSDLMNVAQLYKRLKNILKNQMLSYEVDVALFEKEQEKALYEILSKIKKEMGSLNMQEKFEEALKTAESLKSPLENFFNEVMVMCENQSVRKNRLALLSNAQALFEGLADISKIGESEL